MAKILLNDLYDARLALLDEIFLQTVPAKSLCDNIGKFFDLCSKFNMKLLPAKCVLFSKEVGLCVRIIFEAAVSISPTEHRCSTSHAAQPNSITPSTIHMCAAMGENKNN